MRLTCPNCSAQYEISAALIPADGREVQCSSCNHIWHSGAVAVDTEAAQSEPQAPSSDASEDREAPSKSPSTESNTDSSDRARPRLDPEVERILREEAAHNRARREQELTGAKMPSMPDALPEQGAKSNDHEDAPTETTQPARKDLLPDISTVSQSFEEPQVAPVLPPEPKGRFRLGFMVSVGLTLGAIGIYASAPQLRANSPAPVGAAVQSYANWVDAQRLRLDSTVQSLLKTAKHETSTDSE